MKICQVCHRTDAFGPIQHDKPWHKQKREHEMIERLCVRKTIQEHAGLTVRYFVKGPLKPVKTFASLAALT